MPTRHYRYRKRAWGGARRRSFKRTTVPQRNRGFLRTGGSYGRYRMPDRMKAAMAAVEYKYLDTNLALTNVSQGGNVFGSICLIPQGDTETDRDGRKCVIKSIWLQMHAQVDQLNVIPSINTNHENLKLWLVLDKQANGANPSIADFLQDATWDGFRNLENSHRFRVLWKRLYTFFPIVATDDGTTIVWTFNNIIIDIYTKVNIPMEFAVGTTGALTTIKSNNVMLIGISEKGIARIHGKFRIRFVG